MGLTVKGILQKINFIETDMDIQRQILHAIPSSNTDEMETVIRKIADQKEQIAALRMEIKSIDEDEYNRIIAIEKAAQMFQQMSADKSFSQVSTLNETGQCFITLTDGTRLDCLVAAREKNGDWLVLTLDGETRAYPGNLVK